MAKKVKKGKRRVITGFTVFLLVALFIAIFFSVNFTTIQVDGTSMYPTLKNRQRVLVSKAYWLIGSIHDKDIVVLRDPKGPGVIIKRVYRTAGEDVTSYWRPNDASVNAPEFIVPAGCIYVLGDNRPVSFDGRYFGPVNMSQVIGKVVVYQ